MKFKTKKAGTIHFDLDEDQEIMQCDECKMYSIPEIFAEGEMLCNGGCDYHDETWCADCEYKITKGEGCYDHFSKIAEAK